MFRRWFDEARRRRAARAQRDGASPPSPPTAGRRRRMVLLKGARRATASSSSPTRLPQGRRARRQPALRAALPLAPARAAGARRGRRRRRWPHAEVDGVLRGPGRAGRSSAPGPRTSPGRSRRAPSSTASYAAAEAAVRRRRRCRCPTSGAATASRPRRSSSGRAGPAGCTTGWSTAAPAAAGRPSAGAVTTP